MSYLWVVINLGGFLIYRHTATGLRDDFYQKGISATQSLSVKTGSSLLGKDILALNVAIGEFLQYALGLVFYEILSYN